MDLEFTLDTGNCKGCGAAICWAKTTSGKPIPLDAKPELRFVPLNSSVVKMREVYVSHFTTCPKANEFRKTTTTTPRSV